MYSLIVAALAFGLIFTGPIAAAAWPRAIRPHHRLTAAERSANARKAAEARIIAREEHLPPKAKRPRKTKSKRVPASAVPVSQ
jgi:hypothetical protein